VVLELIRDLAFVRTPYPLFLTLVVADPAALQDALAARINDIIGPYLGTAFGISTIARRVRAAVPS
jgi:hypothetical protein